MVQKMVQKIVQKIVQGSIGPVHILPYATSQAYETKICSDGW